MTKLNLPNKAETRLQWRFRHLLNTLDDLSEHEVCRKSPWKRHALRAAYFAVDAVWRTDTIGVRQAMKAVDQALGCTLQGEKADITTDDYGPRT